MIYFKPSKASEIITTWTGPDSVLSYKLTTARPPVIEYNKPPPNKYGKLTEVETL